MPIETLSSSYCVSFSSSVESDFAVRENEFGPGYAERDADGINNIRDIWSVEFGQMPYSEMSAVWVFLQNKKGYVSFWWTPPREDTARKWVCTQLTRTMESFNEWTINAVFQEQFSFLAGSIAASTLIGVQATARTGTVIGQHEIGDTGEQPLEGVQATCHIADIHPVSEPTPFHSAESTYGYRTAVKAGDGYLYVVAGNRWVEKYDPASMQLIDVLDCIGANGITGVGLQHRWYWGMSSASAQPNRTCFIDYDDDYLYIGPFSGDEQNGMYYRVSLSDFRSTTRLIVGTQDINGLGVEVGDYRRGGGGGMFIYNGYMYLLPYFPGASIAPLITRVDLSDFTLTGISTCDLTPFQVNGDKYRAVKGFAVHDHYVTFLTGEFDKRAVRFDLNTFSVAGTDLLDISDAFNLQNGLCGRGAVDSDYIYFSGGRTRVYRIKRDHSAYDVFDYGNAKAGFSGPGFIAGIGTGITSDGHLWIAGAFYAMMVKIDLNSNGGAFSNLTTEFINVFEYALGDEPFGWRANTDQGSHDMMVDDQWCYYFPRKFRGGQHRPIMRVALTQGSFDPWPPRLQSGGDQDIYDYDWFGGDNAPGLLTDVTYSFALSNPIDPTKKYFIGVSARMQSGGAGVINTLTVGGVAATKITDTSNGNSYAGIWMIDGSAHPGATGNDVEFNASDPVYYYEGQIWVVEGMQNAVPNFVHAPISGTGKQADFTFDLPGKGLVFGCVTVDSKPTDWDFNFTGYDASNWSTDNWDYWGPETDYGDATIFLMQFSYLNNTSSILSGENITLSWDSPPDTEDLPYVGVMIGITFQAPSDPAYTVIPIQGVQCIGNVFTAFPDEGWLNANGLSTPVPNGGYD